MYKSTALDIKKLSRVSFSPRIKLMMLDLKEYGQNCNESNAKKHKVSLHEA